MARRQIAVNPSTRGLINDGKVDIPSFRDGPQDQTRNLEIPGSMLRIAPE
jgi:hypothetical protein